MFGTGRGSFSHTWYAADINIVRWPCVHDAGGVKAVVSAGVSKFSTGVGGMVSEEEEDELKEEVAVANDAAICVAAVCEAAGCENGPVAVTAVMFPPQER